MQKIKKKKIINFVNYQQFLKKRSFKLQNIFFENKILYTNLNLESYVIEFNSYENIYLPFTLIKIEDVSTIALKYKTSLLFNYDLTYNILYQFNRIMFQNLLKKTPNQIKGRLLGGNWRNKKILISILGFVFGMKPVNLNSCLNYKKKNYFNKFNKKKFYKRKINSTRLINCYKLKYLNFTIQTSDKHLFKKKELSRISYLQIILENKKIKII